METHNEIDTSDMSPTTYDAEPSNEAIPSKKAITEITRNTRDTGENTKS